MDGESPATPAPLKPAAEMTLADHEMASRARYAKLCSKMKKLKESMMSTTVPDVNVYSKDPSASLMPMLMGGGWGNSGVAGGAGAGLGAGVVGGLLGGLLFNRNGFGGLGGGDGAVGGVVTPSQLQAALNGQTAGQNTTSILQELAAIQASIPQNEGRVQLAIAGAQADVNRHISDGLQVAITGQALINKNIADAIASSLQSQSQIKDLVLTTSAQLAAQGAAQTYALNTAIRDDGDKTRGLIVAQNDMMLNRIITEQANELTELKNDKIATASGITITQTVNQAQAQAQQQQQQQQQLILLSQLVTGLANVTQIAHATNSNVIAGNTGAVTTGTQTASPVNVNS
jgi:hypothetical protein